MSIQELIDKLNSKYSNDVHYVSSIIDAMEEYIECGELDVMPNIIVMSCESIEIERGLWGYEDVEILPLNNFVGNKDERSAVILSMEYDNDSDTMYIDIIPNVTMYDYYVGD